MKTLLIPFLFVSAILFFGCENSEKSTKTPPSVTPNILIIYLDDLGMGDVSAYNQGTLQTPQFDRLASEGLVFNRGYATSATCTPSRYALLTGIYPWRNTRARVLPGNAPLIIDTTLVTLPKLMKSAGYTTGIVGKWHLGLGGDSLNWNENITPGPNEIGFDYSYIMASTNDRSPTVFVEQNRVAGLSQEDPLYVNYRNNFEGEPTGKDHPELLKLHPSHGHDMSIQNGVSRIGFMKGGKSALWIDENMTDTLLRKAQRFISSNKNNPFFLYFSLYQPHVPRVPNERFAGKSGLGPRGDAILEADWAVGELLNSLDQQGLTNQTLVIFSSDNGPVLDDGYQDDAVTKLGNHTPWGDLRGGKYSLFDAGTHVPFITRWPGTILPGSSNALVSQLDFLSSFAALTGQKSSSSDSQNILEALLGNSEVGRNELVIESSGRLAYIEGPYAYIPPYEGPALTNKWVNIETGISSIPQLYQLTNDKHQKINLADSLPEKLKQISENFELYSKK